MEPITELKNEHRGVETMLDIIENVAGQFAQGRDINARDLDAIIEFLTVFVDRCHHGKEEDFLFPALEAAGVPRDQGPIGVLLQEHEQGRRLVAELRDAAKDFTSGDKAAGKTVEKAALDYVGLLGRHIEKEESVLFPMVLEMLGPEKQAELSEAFEKLEEDRIGPGKHEAFHQLLHRLKQVYTD
ncbi:MAG: hemerythrin domain-containing protein [Desulfobacteraceae bacterium]|nr:hemerythrin domain-containing protein [Desulfobacteraceae bacterium]MCF8035782.1 hemerythrin domain-containing protein [Desulfobacteraceae bacterium]